MVLNAYGSSILRSEMEFPIWAAKNEVKNPVQKGHTSEPVGQTKIYDKLVKDGFQVKKSPFTHKFGNEPEMQMYDYIKREGGPEAEETYKVHRFLYQYVYIANMMGIDYADKWIASYKDDKYRQEEYTRAVKNKPKLAYCHLRSSGGQCRMDCPYWNGGCQISSAEEQQSRNLLEKYKPVDRRV